MSIEQKIQEISQKFDINSIYARRVFFEIQENENFLEEAKKIIAEKPKPFVKWVGGKRQLLKQFRNLGYYPPKGFNPDRATYFEPFVGGGAVFFDLLPKNAVLSDLNFELVTTYNVIKNSVEPLIKALKRQRYDKESFLTARSKKVGKLSDLQIATRFIYLNRTCFNGMYRVNSKGEFNVPFGKYNNPLICDEENLRKVSKSLQLVSIKNEDYQNVLKRAKKGDFIYFDPPYHPLSKTASFTAYTNQSFGEKEQIKLKEIFLKLHKRGCFVMLSNSSADFIGGIYSGIDNIKINDVQAGRAINSNGKKRGKIKEVLITNY